MQYIVRMIGALIKDMNPDGTAAGTQPLITALTKYADLITPWAGAVAENMLADVNRRNLKAWRESGADMSKALRNEIARTPVGVQYRELLGQQVTLIKSLPLQAAEHAHELVQAGLFKSTRSTDIAKEILKSSSIPKWRAKLIARTEVSRSAVTLTQVRAQAIGSEGYVWRSVGDADVRDTHKEMNGKYVRWDTPPKTDKSLAPYHAGCGPNCRCWPDPVFPEF